MSARVSVSLSCDYPGPHECRDVRTVRLHLAGKAWETELCAAGRAAAEADLNPFADAARRVFAGQPAGAAARRTMESRRHSARVRAWAKAHGEPLADRGRIPGAVLARYEAAHPAGRR